LCAVLPLRFYDLCLVVIHRFLRFVALEKDLAEIVQMVLLSHKFLIGIVSQPIIASQQLGIGPIENVEDSAVLEDEVFIFVSDLLPHYFEDV
jgi:hypothetical protein